MNNLRVRTTIGQDNHINFRLEQNYDFIEILSVRLDTKDLYRRFCSDFGVLVGRVVNQQGIGVPNAKISIFIPLDEVDANDPLISELYPYTSVKDVNRNGLRYNILPENKNENCHLPVGDFPSKKTLLDNPILIDIHEKYYKFTTSTNDAGDYAFMGVPVGNYTIHMDMDLSDIGFLSVKPYELKNQGFPDSLFRSNTLYKTSTNLDNLTQIITRDLSVDVQPFWGDTEQCEVGITRLDIDPNVEFFPTAIFFGSTMTDNKKNAVNKRCRPRKKMGEINQMTTGSGRIEILRLVDDLGNRDFLTLNDAIIDEDGNYAFLMPMNLDKVVTNEFGDLVPTKDPNKGIPTVARARFRFSLDDISTTGKKRTRGEFLVPNMYNRYEFDGGTSEEDFFEMKWRGVYSTRMFIPRIQKNKRDNNKNHTGIKDVDSSNSFVPFPFNRVDGNLSILFTLLCFIINIIAIIVGFINLLIGFINRIIVEICKIVRALTIRKSKKNKRCEALGGTSKVVLDPDSSTPSNVNIVPVFYDYDNDCYLTGNTVNAELEIQYAENLNLLPIYEDIDGTLFKPPTDGSDNGITKAIIYDRAEKLIVDGSVIGCGGFSASDPDIQEDELGNEVDNTPDNGFIGCVTANGLANGSVINVFYSNDARDPDDENSNEDTIVIYDNPEFKEGMDSDRFRLMYLEITVVTAGVNNYVQGECDCSTAGFGLLTLKCDGRDFIIRGLSQSAREDYLTCIKQVLALQLDAVVFEFYNDWVTGILYFPLLKYKLKVKRKLKFFGITLRKKNKTIEQFCDYDLDIYQGSGNDLFDPYEMTEEPEHKRNKGGFFKIKRTIATVEKENFYDFGNEEESHKSKDSRGIIKEYNNNLYYAAFTKYNSTYDYENQTRVPLSGEFAINLEAGEGYNRNEIMYATDIVDLGSSVFNDPFNRPFLVDEISETSYDLPEIFIKTKDVNGLIDLNCLGIQKAFEDSIVSICEFGSDSVEFEFLEGDEGQIIDVVPNVEDLKETSDYTFKDYIGFTSIDERRHLLENFRIWDGQTLQYGPNNEIFEYVFPFNGDEELQNKVNFPLNDFRLYPENRRSLNQNPFYFYFGTKPEKNAYGLLIKKYFDECYG